MSPQDSAIFTSGCLLVAATASGLFELLRLSRTFACTSMLIVLCGFTAATIHTSAVRTRQEILDARADREEFVSIGANYGTAIRMNSDGRFVDLESGAQVCASGGTHWETFPSELRGASFWRHNDFQQGRAVFTVQDSGIVYLAATCRWLKDGDVTSRDKLLAQGWSYVGDAKSSDLCWHVFKRDCRAGERFSIQTELYTAPVPILLAGK